MAEPTSISAHAPRLDRELHALLQTHRIAALGTLDEAGAPFVSMVPFAIEPSRGWLVVHLSGLAVHTPYLLARPQVALMVMQAERPDEPVHALPRLSLQALAVPLERGSADEEACRAVYLARFPEAEPMTELGDFRFFALQPLRGRHVAGFGAARDFDPSLLVSTPEPQP